MDLHVLTDNTAGGTFCAEHGLSFFIESGNSRLLFDTGHSDLFLRNAQNMGLEILKDTEMVVLSHGHWDHGDGLQFISEMKLVLHPDALMKRYRKRDNSYIGLKLSRAELQQKFELIFTREPLKVTDHIYFLGEIPRLNAFEAKTSAFADETNMNFNLSNSQKDMFKFIVSSISYK